MQPLACLFAGLTRAQRPGIVVIAKARAQEGEIGIRKQWAEVGLRFLSVGAFTADEDRALAEPLKSREGLVTT